MLNVVSAVVRAKHTSLIALAVLAISSITSSYAARVTLAWDPSPDANVVGYKIHYGVAPRTYTNSVNVGNTTTASISNLFGNTVYFFAATAVDDLGLESDFSVEANALITLPNQPPTLNALAGVTINEGAGAQVVNLSGITAGGVDESQALLVTASSSDTGLIPHPVVNYTSPATTGSLSFTPAPFAFGSATVTVTVNDGGPSNNIVTRTFTVTVNPVNQSPTLNTLANVVINEGAGQQTVNLAGISSGATNENQTLTVNASSSNTGLIPNPSVTYTSPNNTGSIRFTPVAMASGSATITVTVNDGGASNNVVTRTFTVTVNPVNQAPTLNTLASVVINENAALQTVNLSGISSGATNENQTLTVTASSSNTGLIPNPTVTYTSPNATGTILFTPVPFGFGSATITVSVNDGAASNNVVNRTFTVTVNPVNQAPSLNTLANMTINENAGLQTIALSGINSGATNENQTLTVTASSSNTSLIPHPTVSYTSPNATGTISFTPAASSSGSALLTVTVNDGGASNNIVTRSFTVTVNNVNQAPTISAIADRTVGVGSAIPAIAFTVSDAETAASSLTLLGNSDNLTLVRPSGMTFGGTGGNRTVTIVPEAGQTGSANITISVNDGTDSASRTFRLTVRAKPLAPLNLRVAQIE